MSFPAIESRTVPQTDANIQDSFVTGPPSSIQQTYSTIGEESNDGATHYVIDDGAGGQIILSPGVVHDGPIRYSSSNSSDLIVTAKPPVMATMQEETSSAQGRENEAFQVSTEEGGELVAVDERGLTGHLDTMQSEAPVAGAYAAKVLVGKELQSPLGSEVDDEDVDEDASIEGATEEDEEDEDDIEEDDYTSKEDNENSARHPSAPPTGLHYAAMARAVGSEGDSNSVDAQQQQQMQQQMNSSVALQQYSMAPMVSQPMESTIVGPLSVSLQSGPLASTNSSYWRTNATNLISQNVSSRDVQNYTSTSGGEAPVSITLNGPGMWREIDSQGNEIVHTGDTMLGTMTMADGTVEKISIPVAPGSATPNPATSSTTASATATTSTTSSVYSPPPAFPTMTAINAQPPMQAPSNIIGGTSAHYEGRQVYMGANATAPQSTSSLYGISEGVSSVIPNASTMQGHIGSVSQYTTKIDSSTLQRSKAASDVSSVVSAYPMSAAGAQSGYQSTSTAYGVATPTPLQTQPSSSGLHNAVAMSPSAVTRTQSVLSHVVTGGQQQMQTNGPLSIGYASSPMVGGVNYSARSSILQTTARGSPSVYSSYTQQRLPWHHEASQGGGQLNYANSASTASFNRQQSASQPQPPMSTEVITSSTLQSRHQEASYNKAADEAGEAHYAQYSHPAASVQGSSAAAPYLSTTSGSPAAPYMTSSGMIDPPNPAMMTSVSRHQQSGDGTRMISAAMQQPRGSTESRQQSYMGYDRADSKSDLKSLRSATLSEVVKMSSQPQKSAAGKRKKCSCAC